MSSVLEMRFNIDLKRASKNSSKLISYGTAGFRSQAENLGYVLYRTGILSVLRSKKKNGKTIGLMITASHNPECDNGVKLIDPYGEMLEMSWESLVTSFINAEDNDLEKNIQSIVDQENIDMNINASVYIGRDTRSSSPKLSELAIEGIAAFKGLYLDYGIVTTPVLHYMVYCKNKSWEIDGSKNKLAPTEMDYNLKLIKHFKLLNNNIYIKGSRYIPDLILDGANGVGAIKAKELMNELRDSLNIFVYNDGNGILNCKCGADYVKVNQVAPEGIPLEPNKRCVSLDGDADRLIYFYLDGQKQFHMLDGDRIAILVAEYLMELICLSNVKVNLGLVQTAYANGNSTDYIINKLKVPVACVPTGVKHLHQKAKEFDIGVYFEANGHGTIIYSDEAEEKIRTSAESKLNEAEQRNAALRLLNLIKLTNQTVGDAISDVLLVETILKAKGWSIIDWEKCYVDLPNRLMKVTIKDRNVIENADAARICTKPEGLQDEINAFSANFSKGRAFVRPSGTEDVVRVYAEAATQSDADELCSLVALAVYKMAGGLGSPPTCPKQ